MFVFFWGIFCLFNLPFKKKLLTILKISVNLHMSLNLYRTIFATPDIFWNVMLKIYCAIYLLFSTIRIN